MTDPTPTDWRELCAELADSVELLLEMREVDAKPMAITENRLSRARVALAQPEPKMVYRYSPVTIAECGGPCEQGPQYCDCGEIKGELETQSEPQEDLTVTKEKVTTNWFEKLEVEIIDEEDGGCTIRIDWDNEDPDLEYWTNLGEEGQKSFIIEALNNALDCYVD